MDPRLEAIVERMLEKYDKILLLLICQHMRWIIHLLFTLSDILLIILYCRCILDGKYQQAMGMAVECRRLDKLESAIVRCDNIHGALSYCINLSHQYVNHREYRFEVGSWNIKFSALSLLLSGWNIIIILEVESQFSIQQVLLKKLKYIPTDQISNILSLQVLRCLVKIYQTLPHPDYLSICQCLMFLGEPETVANILDKLLSGSKVWVSLLF